MHVAGESHPRKMLRKPAPEPPRALHPRQFLGRKAQLLQECQRLLQPRRDQKVAARRQFSHEELEHRDFPHAVRVVHIEHGELIQVR